MLQLRHIHYALYKKGYHGKAFFKTKWKSNQPNISSENESEKETFPKDFEYFTHASTARWTLPALHGKVFFLVDDNDEKEIFFNRKERTSSIKNQTHFLELHFQPIYKTIENYIKNDRHNLRDLMGHDKDIFKGSGSSIRKTLVEQFKDPKIIRKLVITQQIILEQYEYRACDFRDCIMTLIDSAIRKDDVASQAMPDTTPVNSGLLTQLRIITLNLLSRGNDAAALACLLLYAALQEDAAPFLFRFMDKTLIDLLVLKECEKHVVSRRLDLGNDLYLTYSNKPNYIGGSRAADITLWKFPDIMIEKITDNFGYFFYPVEIKETKGFRHSSHKLGPSINYSFNISPYKNDYAMFEWTYQPDGRYFSDEQGFGADHCDEIVMYAYMDKQGRFVTPFSVKKPALPKSNEFHQET